MSPGREGSRTPTPPVVQRHLRGGVVTILGVGHMMLDETWDVGADYERTDLYADFIPGLINAHP